MTKNKKKRRKEIRIGKLLNALIVATTTPTDIDVTSEKAIRSKKPRTHEKERVMRYPGRNIRIGMKRKLMI